MLTPPQALEIILSNTPNPDVERIPIDQCYGRFLAEEIVADSDFPPYNRVAMDGIAIRAGDSEGPLREYYIVQGIQAAGSAQMTLQDGEHCVEIMTGSVLPVGADAVIPYEDVDINGGKAYPKYERISKRNIHYQGTDHKKGHPALPAGKRINSADVGVLATVGLAQVPVFRLPKVALLSTGDELVDITEVPLPHQVRKSNIYTLAASLGRDRIRPDIFHVNDKAGELERRIGDLLDTYDVLMMSGGVSMGKYDLIPGVLEHLGVQKGFHKVAQKPGKPFWFGHSERSGTHVFAYPGNPVSTFVCHNYYFRHWLYGSCGAALPLQRRSLAAPFRPHPVKALFATVGLDEEGRARQVQSSGSGDLFSLRHADGFLLVPAGDTTYETGTSFPFIPIL